MTGPAAHPGVVICSARSRPGLPLAALLLATLLTAAWTAAGQAQSAPELAAAQAARVAQAVVADQAPPEPAAGQRHLIETFPIMFPFRIFSGQYSYRLSPRTDLITGLAYANAGIYDRAGNLVGRLHAPTVPVGLRRYLWRNFHIEYQLWPAYNFYHEVDTDSFFNGFDLYSEIRAGYRLDFDLGRYPLFTNLQYVFGVGLYPGNKPDSFHDVLAEAPLFHVPSISIGLRF